MRRKKTMSNYLEFKNISTILTTIFLALFGALIGYLSSKGINLPVTAETLTSIALAIIFAVFGYYNAKNNNDLFDKENDTAHIPVPLTQAQIDAIQNFINIQTGAEVEIIGDDQPENDVDVDDREINQ